MLDIPVDEDRFVSHKAFAHSLIVFGGVGGIEEIVESDESLSISRDECHTLFDLWVNTCP